MSNDFNEKWDPVAKQLGWRDHNYPGERKMLEDIIDADEGILAMVGGMFAPDLGQAGATSQKRRGISVATTNRILFLDKGVFGSSETAEMYYDTVSGITHSTGMFRGGIRIVGRGSAGWQIEMVAKDQIMPFVNTVRAQMDQVSEEVQTAVPGNGMENDILAEMVQQQTRTNELLEQLLAKD